MGIGPCSDFHGNWRRAQRSLRPCTSGVPAEGWLAEVGVQSGVGTLPTVTASLAAFRRKRGGTGENYRCAVSDPLCVLMNGYLQFGEDGPGFVRALRGNSFHTELSDAIIETTSAQIHENRIRLSRRRAQYLIPQFPGLFPTVHTVEANPISKFLQEVNRGLASLGRWDRLEVLLT